jgi:hypothetical protein
MIEAIERFVEREYQPLTPREKEEKALEIMVGYKGYIKKSGKFFFIFRLPEGVEGVIDQNGLLYDVDEISYIVERMG